MERGGERREENEKGGEEIEREKVYQKQSGRDVKICLLFLTA